MIRDKFGCYSIQDIVTLHKANTESFVEEHIFSMDHLEILILLRRWLFRSSDEDLIKFFQDYPGWGILFRKCNLDRQYFIEHVSGLVSSYDLVADIAHWYLEGEEHEARH